MVKSNEPPKKIAPYLWHGLDLSEGSSNQWIGDCPYCSKEGKFYVSSDTGQFDCKSCASTGNAITFMTDYVDNCINDTSKKDLLKLAKDRKIPWLVLKKYNIFWDGDYFQLPVMSEKGTVRDIRRFSLHNRRLFSTKGCSSQLWGLDRLANALQSSRVWLVEGEWDGLALCWLLDELDDKRSIVVAVPGAGTLKQEWLKWFKGMNVIGCYDNDEAGKKGAEKAYKCLKDKVASIRFVDWGEDEKEGYDLRDFIILKMKSSMMHPENVYDELMERVVDDIFSSEDHKPELESIELQELIEVFDENMELSEDLIIALKVMLAVCLSNDIGGDPLWIYMVAPPGAGKTLILTSFSHSWRCVFRSNLTPKCLVSGWQGSGADPSLIPRIAGKTLIAKDFTEILSMSIGDQEEIFSTLRGAYDGYVQKSFGNGITREYYNCRFSIIAGVTPKIHGSSRASMGERFLKMVMNVPSDKKQTEVNFAALDQIGNEETLEYTLQTAVARYLSRKLTPRTLPKFSVNMKYRINALVKLIAMMRTQVDRDLRMDIIQYRPEPEMGTRLIKQLGKLAMLIAYMDNEKEINEDAYKIVERVAFNTAHGFTLEIVASIMKMGGKATRKEISEDIGLPMTTLGFRIEDMVLIKVLKVSKRDSTGGRLAKEYSLSDKVFNLWRQAKGEISLVKKKNKRRKK